MATRLEKVFKKMLSTGTGKIKLCGRGCTPGVIRKTKKGNLCGYCRGKTAVMDRS